MSEYKIITDSGSDLPKDFLAKLDVQAVPLYVNFRGECPFNRARRREKHGKAKNQNSLKSV